MVRWLAVVALIGACRPTASPAATSPPPSSSAPASTPAPPQDPPKATEAANEPVQPQRDDEVASATESFVLPVPQLPDPSDAPVASRIKVGEYRCKISREYRFRPCTVTLDEHGRSILTIPHALLALQGVLTDEGKRTKFDGIQTDPQPFGCPFCADRCVVEPESCACKEGSREILTDCVLQPIRFAISKRDKEWRGKIEYRTYSAYPDPDGGPGYDVEPLQFVMRR